MEIISINDLSNICAISLLEKAFSEINDENIIRNYHPDYKDRYENIFYLLKNGRYRNGQYFILLDDKSYVCSSGWNPYHYIGDTAILMSRTYIDEKYRAKYLLSQFLLPMMLQNSSNFDRKWITINYHNETLYKWWIRANDNKPTALFNDWPAIYRKFKPIGQKYVYNTLQHIVEYKET